MNRGDSSGFNIRKIAEGMEILRAERFVLIEYPERDLKQWIVNVDGRVAGFVDQWSNGRFWVRSMGRGVVDYTSGGMDEPTVAFSSLEEAVASVEFRTMIHASCGVCDGTRQ
jgi:hypothetical protein